VLALSESAKTRLALRGGGSFVRNPDGYMSVICDIPTIAIAAAACCLCHFMICKPQ